MCHLDNLNIAREPLPLPGDHNYIHALMSCTSETTKTADAEQNITLKWLKQSLKPQAPSHASRLLHS